MVLVGGLSVHVMGSALQKIGFKLVEQNTSNKMFVQFLLKKELKSQDAPSVAWPALKACTYKKR